MNIDLFDRKIINRFHGENGFLSNFYLCPIEYDGIIWPSVEHAYQAAKCADLYDRWKFKTMSAGQAKRMGRKIEIRPDWEHIKRDIMYNLVWLKFNQNPDMAKMLLDTGDALLEEGNTWGDKYWGTVDGIGQNHLGMILMHIREELRSKYVAN